MKLKDMKTFLIIFCALTVLIPLVSGCGAGNSDNIPPGQVKKYTGTVTGTVTDSNGNPITGTQIRISQKAVASLTTTTDSSGMFLFDEVYKGDYSLTASCIGYSDYSANIVVVARETTQHNFQMTDALGQISGRVMYKGRPVPGAQVSVRNESTISAEDGTYSLTGLQEGTQTITAVGIGLKDYSAQVDIVGNVDVHHDIDMAAVDNYVFHSAYGTLGTQPGEFDRPYGIFVDDAGFIFIADSRNDRIQKFDSAWNNLGVWGSSGTNPGEFNVPLGIAVGNDGSIYVADTWNDRIQKLDSDGNPLAVWGSSGTNPGQFDYPTEICVDTGGSIYVVEEDNNRVQKLDANGNPLIQWGVSGTGPVEFNSPRGLALDGDRNIYVADTSNQRIQKFDQDGNSIFIVGTLGDQPGEFQNPYGIYVDYLGNIFVADTTNHRIQKLDPDGEFITQWGSYGIANGQFDRPIEVFVDKEGTVYVMDTFNYRVQKFVPGD